MEPSRAGPPVRVASLALVIICFALGAISALEARLVSVVHGFPMPWTELLAANTPRWVFMALALPLVLRLSVRYPLVPFQ